MMRGGPRLMCSPYLTGSLVIMLVIVVVNYWTVATENADLAKKIQEMQQQLKSGTVHITNLEEELKLVRENEKNCKHNSKQIKEESEVKYRDLEKQREKLERQLKDRRKDEEEEEKKHSEDREMQEKVVDNLRDEVEILKQNITNLQQNITICQSELNSERADKILVPPQGAGIPPRHLPSKLGPGQLPDVSPDAVSVVRKETQGMRFHKDKTGHWLPILPQGDPHKPRATPSVSVMDIKPEADSKRVKKNALSGGAGLRIEEGEVKDVLQDPNINIVHVSSSRKPVMMSSSSLSDNLDPEDDKEVVNEAGVMPLPNLDKAEDDSNVDHNEVVDDDQNPDGQIDETVDLDKQSYIVDKDQTDDENETGEGDKVNYADADDDKEENDISSENEGEIKLENLKENLNKEEEPLV